MIERREAYLARSDGGPKSKVTTELRYSADNANEAMRILGLIEKDPAWGDQHPRWNVSTWAAQAALSRPGRRKIEAKEAENVKKFTMHPEKLKWPRGRLA